MVDPPNKKEVGLKVLLELVSASLGGSKPLPRAKVIPGSGLPNMDLD